MDQQNVFFKILKSGSALDRKALFDRLPDVPSKSKFRIFVDLCQEDDKLQQVFNYLSSVYCNGVDLSIGKDLSYALYQVSKEQYDVNSANRPILINNAYNYTRALNQLGEHEADKENFSNLIQKYSAFKQKKATTEKCAACHGRGKN